jgi:Uma2 family endonuclease
MCATAVQSDERVEVFFVPASAYRKIAKSFGRGVVEYDARTETLLVPALLTDVSWEQYELLVETLPGHRLRHDYDRGTLEMMSPSTNHEWIKEFLARLIGTMAYEFSISIKSAGSTTRRSKAAQKGLEPDESYYIANERLMRDRFDDVPDRDPPPDLAIEVDIRRAAAKRQRIYASLGVREVWRHDGKKLSFFQLAANGKYERITKSLSFPFLEPRDFDRVIKLKGTLEENELVGAFMELARAKLSKKSGPRTTKKKSPKKKKGS